MRKELTPSYLNDTESDPLIVRIDMIEEVFLHDLCDWRDTQNSGHPDETNHPMESIDLEHSETSTLRKLDTSIHKSNSTINARSIEIEKEKNELR